MIPRRPLTMPPLKRDPIRPTPIHIRRPRDRLRRNPLLNPLHHRHQHVLSRIQTRGARGSISDIGCTGSTATVCHARNGEVAVEVVELGGGESHGIGDLLVVAGGVFARDGAVGETVVVEEFAAAGLEGGEVGVEGFDVEEVEVGGADVVGGCEAEGVPICVVEDGVGEPVCGAESLAIEIGLWSAGQFGARLETWVYKAAVDAEEGRVDGTEGVGLGWGETGVVDAVACTADKGVDAELTEVG